MTKKEQELEAEIHRLKLDIQRLRIAIQRLMGADINVLQTAMDFSQERNIDGATHFEKFTNKHEEITEILGKINVDG